MRLSRRGDGIIGVDCTKLFFFLSAFEVMYLRFVINIAINIEN